MRLLEFMGAAARLDETSRSDLERLKASLRRLAAQLNSMHRPTTSIAVLEAAGKWAEHELVQEKVRAEANAALDSCENAAHRDARLARRIHDALMCTLVTVDCAPNRPGCLRVLKVPGSTSPCGCGADGCAGNRFVGMTMVLVHSKTARFRSNITVDFSGTLTERLLSHHLSWGRALLLASGDDTDSVWISTRGRSFGSDESFGAYLPRILARLDLPHLSFTTLRHAAVVAASEWATREELEGMAISIGTSVRKIQAVYDYRCAERSAGRFLAAFRGRGSPVDDDQPDAAGNGSGSAGSGSAVDALSAPAPPREATPAPPRAPEPTPRSINPIQAFSRLLGIGRSPPEAPAAAEPSAPAPDDVILDDDGAWRGAFELPAGGAQRGDAPDVDLSGGRSGGGGPHRFKSSSAVRTQPATQPMPMEDGDEEEEGEEEEEEEEEPPVRRRFAGSFNGSRTRVEVRTNVTSFAAFLAQQKGKTKTYTGGPGRSAAPVKRWLTHADAALALRRGISAQRAAYAFAYGYATTSGNLAWLRAKIEDAVQDDDDE